VGFSTTLAGWQKGPIRVALQAVSVGTTPPAASALTHWLTTKENDAWPQMNRAWQEHRFLKSVQSSPQLPSEYFGAAANFPTEFTIEVPATAQNLAIMLLSLHQDTAYDTTHYLGSYWSAPVGAKAFVMTMEIGISQAGTYAIRRFIGCVVKSLKVNVPAVEQLAGPITLSATIIGTDVGLASAFTAGGSADATTLLCAGSTSTKMTYTPVATPITIKTEGFEFTLSNNAIWKTNHGENKGTVLALGGMSLDGSLSLLLTDAEFATFMATYSSTLVLPAAIYLGDLITPATPICSIVAALLLQDANIQEQGSAVSAQFSFSAARHASVAYSYDLGVATLAWPQS
jgi:hypothetical protein